jgi:hypothetical protein
VLGRLPPLLGQHRRRSIQNPVRDDTWRRRVQNDKRLSATAVSDGQAHTVAAERDTQTTVLRLTFITSGNSKYRLRGLQIPNRHITIRARRCPESALICYRFRLDGAAV